MARLIAIDLGADAVKVSVFQGAAGTATLEEEVSRRVPQDATAPPTLADRLAVLDLVLGEHPDWATASHLAGLVWPSSRVSTRRLKLPFTDEAQIEQTLPFAIEAEVPFDLDEMVLTWRRLDDEGTLLATLASKQELGAAVAGLAARGLDPKHICPDGGLLSLYAPDALVTAVIDVGHDHTTVAIARHGVTLVHRSIGVAGRTFTRVIADALGCSWAEAEVLKHGGDDVVIPGDDGPSFDGFGDDDDEPTAAHEAPVVTAGASLPDKAKAALDGAIGLLLAEIRTTLVQAEDDLGVGIEQVVLVGGGGKLAELPGWLEQDLGLPVRRPADPIDGAGVPVPPETAAGRAMGRQIAADKLDDVTDLRTGELAWRGGIDRTRLVMTYGGMGLATYILFLLVFTGWSVFTYRQQRSELDERIHTAVLMVAPDAPADLDATGASSLVADLVDDARTEAEFLGSTEAAPPTVELLYQLTEAFPAHPDVIVNVDELDISPGAIQIEGVTDGFAQVDQIGQSLEDAHLFPKVVATPGTKDRDGKLSFTVDISREEVVGEGEDGVETDAPIGEEG